MRNWKVVSLDSSGFNISHTNFNWKKITNCRYYSRLVLDDPRFFAKSRRGTSFDVCWSLVAQAISKNELFLSKTSIFRNHYHKNCQWSVILRPWPGSTTHTSTHRQSRMKNQGIFLKKVGGVGKAAAIGAGATMIVWTTPPIAQYTKLFPYWCGEH